MFVSSPAIQNAIAARNRTLARYERAYYNVMVYRQGTDELEFIEKLLDMKEHHIINLAKAKAKAWNVTKAYIRQDAYASGVVLETA